MGRIVGRASSLLGACLVGWNSYTDTRLFTKYIEGNSSDQVQELLDG
jgi:hypothetical protein